MIDCCIRLMLIQGLATTALPALELVEIGPASRVPREWEPLRVIETRILQSGTLAENQCLGSARDMTLHLHC